jgi:transcriptional regulator with XRE-family HTH domain
MRFEAITIKDIAQSLGLSTSTISRALRGSYEISPETKERVLLYAKEHNYRPNPIALSLKEKRSSSIGVLVSEIANSFFSQAINGIESVAQEKGYNVIIALTENDNYDLSVYVFLEKTERMSKLLNLFEVIEKISTDLLSYYNAEVELYENKEGFPVFKFNFTWDRDEDDEE